MPVPNVQWRESGPSACLYPPHSPRRQVLEKLSSDLTPWCALECGKAPLMFICLSTVIRPIFLLTGGLCSSRRSFYTLAFSGRIFHTCWVFVSIPEFTCWLLVLWFMTPVQKHISPGLKDHRDAQPFRSLLFPPAGLELDSQMKDTSVCFLTVTSGHSLDPTRLFPGPWELERIKTSSDGAPCIYLSSEPGLR